MGQCAGRKPAIAVNLAVHRVSPYRENFVEQLRKPHETIPWRDQEKYHMYVYAVKWPFFARLYGLPGDANALLRRWRRDILEKRTDFLPAISLTDFRASCLSTVVGHGWREKERA